MYDYGIAKKINRILLSIGSDAALQTFIKSNQLLTK